MRRALVVLALVASSGVGTLVVGVGAAHADGVGVGSACVGASSGGADGHNVTGTQLCTTPFGVGN